MTTESTFPLQICDKHGGVDVLINNAGVFGPSGDEQGPLKGEGAGLKCAVHRWDAMPDAASLWKG